MSDRGRIPLDELEARQKEVPDLGTKWQHYRGGYYILISGSIDESTGEPRVLYQPAAPIWTSVKFDRPLREWQELVEYEGRKVPRFTRVR